MSDSRNVRDAVLVLRVFLFLMRVIYCGIFISALLCYAQSARIEELAIVLFISPFSRIGQDIMIAHLLVLREPIVQKKYFVSYGALESYLRLFRFKVVQ